MSKNRKPSPHQIRSKFGFPESIDASESLDKIQTNTKCLSNLVLRESRLRDSSDILDEEDDSR